MTRKIIIDTDPGQDDAVAILLALASPEELDVLGVVAVAGNVGLHHNANNARKVVELSGRRDIPVYAGCARPLRRHLVTAEHVHGDTGLNGPDLPDPDHIVSAPCTLGGGDVLDSQQTHASDLAALEDLAERFRIPTGTGAADQIFREPDSLQKALT